jgi:predicted NAD/FAD-dependent oxidoreductase
MLLPEVRQLEQICFDPCLCVMAVFDRPTELYDHHPGAVQRFVSGVADEPISWMADNQEKGISDAPAVTIHAGPLFSQAHYDTPPEEVAHLLVSAAREHLGTDARLVKAEVKKWRYSRPTSRLPQLCLGAGGAGGQLPPLVICGDAFGDQGAIEGAAMSGEAAAEELMSRMGLRVSKSML